MESLFSSWQRYSVPPLYQKAADTQINMIPSTAFSDDLHPHCKNVQQYLDYTFFHEFFSFFDIIRRCAFICAQTASLDPSFFFSVFFSFFLQIRLLRLNYVNFWNVSTYNIIHSWDIWNILNSHHSVSNIFFLTR